MAIAISISQFTHLTFLLLLLFPISSLNITHILSTYSQFSDFASLLSSTAVAADLSLRSSVTLLAVPNDHLPADITSILPDVLRYHVLLDYLTLTDLRAIPPTGRIATTLYQATGRAPVNSGDINITYNSTSNTVAFHSLATASNATMIPLTQTLIRDQNVSIIPLDSLLAPYNPDLMASEIQPPQGIDIIKQLIDGHNFNLVASMLTGSGVISQFEAAEGGAGITLFVPTDGAFNDLPSHVGIKSMPADEKTVVLKYHVLHSYYTLGTLESIVNPVYPTLATEQIGAGKFTVNISRVNGSLAIGTGVVLASITQTVFDQNPVSIFGVSSVLLPREYFGDGGAMPSAPPPDTAAPSPENPPSPPTVVVNSAVSVGVWRIAMAWGCAVMWCVFLL